MLSFAGKGFRVIAQEVIAQEALPIKREARVLRKHPLKCIFHFGFGQ